MNSTTKADKIATLLDPVLASKSAYNTAIKAGLAADNRAVAQDAVLNLMHARSGAAGDHNNGNGSADLDSDSDFEAEVDPEEPADAKPLTL